MRLIMDISSIENSSDNEKNDFFMIDPITFFSKKECCHYKLINKFFKKCDNMDLNTMIDIIESKSTISLRVLDWFVTKYAKKRINLNNSSNCETLDVRLSYKAQLKSYKKKYFDPFRRKKKFYYPCDENGITIDNYNNKYIFTTLGQLNFFRWAFTNNIIHYVNINLDKLITEMNSFNKDEKLKKIKSDKLSNEIIKREIIKLDDKTNDKFIVKFD